jgi:hypothetical protein
MTLESYSKELGLTETITLESLIDSHNHLRSLVRSSRLPIEEAINQGRKQGLIEGRK